MRNKVISILFCLLLAAGAAAHFLLPDRSYSDHEKRLLAQAPGLTWRTLRTGKYGEALEEYLADQFPGRDGWVTVKTVTDRIAGKRESGGVWFADDGYLIEVHRSFDEAQTAKNLAALKGLQDALAERDIPLWVMPVPTAGEILSDKLPAFAPNADQKAVLQAARDAGLEVVDATGILEAHKDEAIYYRTDHHWTTLGAYYGYAAWKQAKGETAEPISAWQSEILCDNFLGTTYAKVNDPFAEPEVIEARYRTETHRVDYNDGWKRADSIYERSYLTGSNQYAVFLNGNQAATVVSGSGTGRCLILKDSYANCFAQFCVDEFAETHLIDLRFFRGSVRKYAEEHGITEVLVLYNVPNFTEDTYLAHCSSGEPKNGN